MVEWLLCRFYDILKPTMKWIIYLFHKTIWVSGSATTQILPITVQSLNKLDLLKTSLPLYMLILWFVAVVYNLGKCMGWQQQRMKSGYFPWTKPLFWHQNCTNANYLCWFSSLAVQRKLSLHKIMTPSSGYYLCSFFQRYLSAAKVCASFFLFLQISFSELVVIILCISSFHTSLCHYCQVQRHFCCSNTVCMKQNS